MQYVQFKLPGNFSTFTVSDQASPPGIDDRDKAWLKIDETTCRALGWFVWNGSTWMPVENRVVYGEDSGTVNAVEVTQTEPETASYEDGFVFVVKITNGNTAAATFEVGSLGAKAIKKNGSYALEGYELFPGYFALLAYNSDADCFQLMNPSSFEIPKENGLKNPSFEVDLNGDDIPDMWTWAGDATKDIPANESAEFGQKCFQITASADGETGSLINNEYLQCGPSEPVCLEFSLKAADADIAQKIEFYWFGLDNGGTIIPLSAGDEFSVVYDKSAGNPTAWVRQIVSVLPPATARFFKIKFSSTGTASGTGLTSWDNFRLTYGRFTNRTQYSVTGIHQWICPATVKRARVTCVGAGGGGDQSGGGGGGTAIVILDVQPDTEYPIVVGLGGLGEIIGTGARDAVAGANSSFNAAVIGNGGAEGKNAVDDGGYTLTGGSGGSGTATNGIIYAGKAGGSCPDGTHPGYGGESFFGGGGGKGGWFDSASPGLKGSIGGGGGGYSTGGADRTAGDGGDGLVIIEY